MKDRTQIVHGGVRNGDYENIFSLAKAGKTNRWACGKETKSGDTILIYFEQPHSSIVASAVALKDAVPGDHWPYVTRVGKIKILSEPITLAEMKEMFPCWKWLNYPRSKQYLDKTTADTLLKRAKLRLKTPPATIKVSGAGFGSPEQNRLVERIAVGVVRKHFENKGYKVLSREIENVGYDFDLTRKGETLHVEVKGISGSALKFPITANEVGCARSDSKFRLVVVTEAMTPHPHLHVFTQKEFLKGFGLKPLAFFAEAKRELAE